jgi:RNA polymerase sigma factor (TIGR02999 family)
MDDNIDVTQLIHRAQQGDSQAADALFSASYQNLRVLARARLRAGRRETFLNTTSLVHEFYLRFAGAESGSLQNREHFMCYASRAMRCVIVDSVRKRQAARRGCGGERVTMTARLEDFTPSGEDEILRVHQAIDEVAKVDTRMAQVVEMRYFGGLTDAEIAGALCITDRTVRRDWEKARLLLFEALQ